MKLRTLLTAVLAIIMTSLSAQMWTGQDSLYGNEWIDFEQSYYKIMLEEDGIYRLTESELAAAGVPTSAIAAGEYQLYYLGEEIPLYASAEGNLNDNDYLEFYGRKNRSELDRFLYSNPDQQLLNPKYSLFTDTSAYFLTWGGGQGARYTEVAADFDNLPAAEQTFEYEQDKLYTANWYKEHTTNNDYSSFYGKVEGFTQLLQGEQQVNLTADFLAAGANSVEMEIRFLTANGSHDFKATVNGQVMVEEPLSSNYQIRQYNWDVPVNNSNPQISALLESTDSELDAHALTYITLRYPRNFDFQNDIQTLFTIEGGERKLLEITNFNHNGTAPILYDVTNGMRIPTRLQGGVVQAVLPAGIGNRELALVNANNGFKIDYLVQPINFIDYTTQEAEFLIITNPVLYDDGNGNNFIEEYKSYRSSQIGGNYNVTVAEIQQIYDQFAYGINRHNIAVQNFANYLHKEWEDWKYALMIGKSRSYDDVRTNEDLNFVTNQTFYLPTFGYPGADVLMFSSPGKMTPHVGVGRIAAASPKDVQIYLNKLITYEDEHQNAPQTIEARGWMHRVMHLGGGSNSSEQSNIKSRLDNMENILKNNKFGGDVTGFFKTSTESIQPTQSAELTNLINSGVALITFFGHSSSNSFDFSLDSPENYENQDRYPVISSYGCYAGQIHQNGRSIGERFIFAEERGAIGFFASVSQAYISDLSQFGNTYFRAVGDDLYGESIGLIQRATTQRLLPSSGVINEDNRLQQLLMQTTYQGDPAVRLNYETTPDYIPDTRSVSIEPGLINIETVDTISIEFDLVNIGTNTLNSIQLKIEQELPNGDRVLHLEDNVSMTLYRKHMEYELPILGEPSIGLNRLHVIVDSDDVVVELPNPAAENNNNLVDGNGREGIEYLIFSNDARPLYPTQFGIVGNRSVELKASTTNTFAELQPYVFEMDTTELFNSGEKQRFAIEQKGGILKWQPNYNFQDSTVYYWRVSPDSTAQFGYLWQNSSFVFLEDSSPGFNQSHYFQMTDAEYITTELQEDRGLEFGKVPVVYQLQNGLNSFFYTGIQTNSRGIVSASSISATNIGVMVTVFDGLNGEVWTNTPTGVTETNEENCSSTIQFGEYESQFPASATRTENAFQFRTETLTDRLRLINFLENVIPEGSFVVFQTLQKPVRSNNCWSYFPERWAADSTSTGGSNLFNILEREGALAVRGLQNEEDKNIPYVFAYRKGDPSVDDAEKTGGNVDPQSSFFVDFAIPSSATAGTVETQLIGPATNWESLEWKISGKDSDTETGVLNIYGYSPNKEKNLIYRGLELEFSTLNSVDASEYPYLQLEYEAEDTEFRTPQQLEYWRVLYDGIPEAALNQSAAFIAVKDTLEQGEPLEFMIAAENVSDYDLDSLLVKYSFTDVTNNEIVIQDRVAPLLSNDTIQLRLNYDTRNLNGLQTLRVEINPDEDQAEQTHINNVGFLQFVVQADERNPLLDVTFDGIRIMNGDLVSPDPLISISLDDENEYLRLADTSLFQISLILPDGNVTPLSFDRNGDILHFIPAAADADNRAIVEFSPIFEQNGDYTLVVQAKDATGNKSGDIDYRVDFEVVIENSISNVFNFPNPFTTSTHFVYTLTGHTPEFFTIQIMTVSGRVVRQITQDELGPLKVGTHQTDYAWDGTDEYGDQLANGIYLYRIITKDVAGEDYEKYETGTDSFFKNNFGKMVLIR